MNDMLSLIERCTRETAEERGFSVPEDFCPETSAVRARGSF